MWNELFFDTFSNYWETLSNYTPLWTVSAAGGAFAHNHSEGQKKLIIHSKGGH